MISFNCTQFRSSSSLDVDVTPAGVGDELDSMNAASPRWIKFHTSVETLFGQTRSRSYRRSAFYVHEV